MQLNNAALKRPSEKPASASNASENTTLAKARGNFENSDSDPQTHTQLTQGHNGDTTESQERGRNGHHPHLRPQHGTANAGQDSGYSNISIYTLYTAEILQPANGCRKEEARATTLCMAWHAQQEASSCATIPTDNGQRGHSASTTSVAAGGVAITYLHQI